MNKKNICISALQRFQNDKSLFSKGIKKYADTLSEKGGYCHFEANATYDCAICVAGMNTYSLLLLMKHMIFFCFFLIIDSIQCGPFVDLPTPQSKFTEGQYCYRGGPDSVCWGRSKAKTNSKKFIV